MMTEKHTPWCLKGVMITPSLEGWWCLKMSPVVPPFLSGFWGQLTITSAHCVYKWYLLGPMWTHLLGLLVPKSVIPLAGPPPTPGRDRLTRHKTALDWSIAQKPQFTAAAQGVNSTTHPRSPLFEGNFLFPQSYPSSLSLEHLLQKTWNCKSFPCSFEM